MGGTVPTKGDDMTSRIPRQLRFNDLKELGIVGSWAQLRRLIDLHGFPAGRLMGPNTRTFDEPEVADWVATRPTETKPGPRRHPRQARRTDAEATTVTT
jgi:hypothetical protein